jgi:BlaI family transcriptional regulator, penicillinase repressor
MDVLYKHGPSSSGEVCAKLPDAPSETAMRTLLRILEDKGHVRHEKVGRRNVYAPTVRRDTARRSAARHLVSTFFGGMVKDAVAALLDTSDKELTPAQRRELIALINSSRERGE